MRSDERLVALRPTAILVTCSVLLGLIVSSGSAQTAAQQNLARGIDLYLHERYAEALPLLQRATRELPKDAQAWTWLGACYIQLGRFPEATRALERALLLDKGNVAAWFYLGVAQARQQHVAEAREAFSRAISLDPAGNYASIAREWLGRLGAGATRAPSPPAGSVSKGEGCPAAPLLPQPRPPAPPTRPKRTPTVMVNGFDARIDRDRLVLEGTIENASNDDLSDVILLATGFNLEGRAVATATTTLKALELDEDVEFRIMIPLKVPLLWVRVRVAGYSPRQPEEPFHELERKLPPRLYVRLAERAVKVRVQTIPSGRAAAHLLCLAITEAGGVPLRTIRVQLIALGAVGSQRIRIDRQIDLAAGRATGITLTWPGPAMPTVEVKVIQIEVEE